jgi:metallophosphoesterase superfamily enzyme
LCSRLAAKEKSHLVIAGDLFDVPAPDDAALAMAADLFNALPTTCRITLIPGNHDPAAPILQQLSPRIALAPSATVGGYTVIHGHRIEDARPLPARLIVGHQHPAVILRNRIQSAKMPCYAVCKLRVAQKNLTLILLPPFSRAPLGSDLTKRNWILNLPWPGESHIQILGLVEASQKQVLDFGPLSDLRA